MSRARTKQVCTIGPASFELIPQLVTAGMDVARINFSHGTPDDHKAYVHAVRAAAHSARRSVAVMADLPGPKLRLGQLEGGEARLETGSTFKLRADDGTPGNASAASVAHPEITARLEVGDRVLLADGAAELRVTEVTSDEVTTEVVNGGLVRSRGGVNVPSERLPGEGLTDEDRAAVPRALELRVDLIAQSFVRTPDDVRALRALLPADGPRLVVKVETRSAVDQFDQIAAEADGVMVARGDLGVDLPFEDVPIVQKRLVQTAIHAGKFVIVATQMLESMTAAPRPTRAEVSDVANAVFDGADAVMLSAETAIGAFPVEALTAMERICNKAEADGGDWLQDVGFPLGNGAADAIIVAATFVSLRSGDGGPAAIWCFTRTGRTAELLSMQRPGVPIVAFTLSPIVARRLAIRSGILPVVMSATAKTGTLIERMEQAWRSQRGGDTYDTVMLVTTSLQPSGINRFEVHHLGATEAG
jgi:pyruvate kinase